METVDWDKRYREGFYDGASGSHGLLRAFWHTIPVGPVLDIAMGNGRNTLYLADKGYEAIGLERSPEAISIAKETVPRKGRRPSLVLGDANCLPFRPGHAAGVLVFYFLLRNIMTEIKGLLRPGGVLIYETFLKRQNAIDRHRNPDYLLDDGELFSCFSGLDLLFYEETMGDDGGKKRAVAKYVGRKR